MEKAKKALKPSSWSPRSQRIVLEERRLRSELKQKNTQLEIEKKFLARDEEQRGRLVDSLASGHGFARLNLQAANAEVEERSAVVRAYKESIAKVEERIAALQPTRQQAQARRTVQGKMSQVAREAQAVIKQLDEDIARMRQSLQRILGLKADLKMMGREIDFTNKDDFGADPFLSLLAALPTALAVAGESWLSWFLGLDRKRQAMITDQDTFPETLASANCFSRGELVLLNQKDYTAASAELPRQLTPLEVEQQALKGAAPKSPEHFSLKDVAEGRISLVGMAL